MQKQATTPRPDTPDIEAIAASDAAAENRKMKGFAILLLIAFVFNLFMMIFVKLAKKTTDLPDWIIFPLAGASAISIVLYLSKRFLPLNQQKGGQSDQ